MTSADPATTETRKANRSRWARLSYRIALLIAILLIGSAIATTVFSVRSVQRTYSKQSTESVTNVHKSVTDTISVANKNVIAYEDAAIASRKNQLKDQSNAVVTALDALNAAVKAGQISLADAQAQALLYLKTIRYGDEYYFFTYNRALTAISHPDPRFEGKNLRDLKDADGSYTSAETGVKLRAGMAVRLKVIGATVLQSALCAIGSIREDFLGLLTQDK